MSSQYYSPNAKGTGAALFATVNAKEEAFFFKLTQQTSWDDATKRGGFAGGSHLNVKLSLDEVGGLLQAIRTNGKFTFFHTSEAGSTTGTFNYYRIESEFQGRPVIKEGFGLTVDKDGVKYKVGLGLGVAERFSEFLKFGLKKCFEVDYSEETRKAKEFAEKRESAPIKQEKPKQKEEVIEENSDLDDIF